MPQKSGKTTARKTPASRAKKGERLLVICEPIMSAYAMQHLAKSLHGMMLTNPDGQIFQIVAVRVDELARRIYGKFQEMVETAPYYVHARVACEEGARAATQNATGGVIFARGKQQQVRRGKTKVRAQIEALILSQYMMEKHPNGCEYTLTIPYDTDEELECIIYEDILREAANLADLRYCFIEADVRALDGSDRSW